LASSPKAMAPCSPISAPARAAKAVSEEIQDQEVEKVAAASNKRRRRGSSSGKKPKPPPKKAKTAKAKSKKEEAARVKEPVEDDVCAEEPDEEEMAMGEEDEAEEQERAAEEAAAVSPEAGRKRDAEEEAAAVSPEKAGRKRVAQPHARRAVGSGDDHDPEFVGGPVPAAEARAKWPKRYNLNAAARRPEDEEEMKARCHFSSAKVENVVYCLGDDVYVQAGDNEKDYIGRITEFFEGADHRQYFTCRWFFRPEDTVINSLVSINVDGHTHDPKRVFLSEEKNDNVLDCITSMVKIVHIDPNMDSKAKAQLIQDCDLYYDMSYSVAYSTFANIPSENGASGSETVSAISSEEVDLETSSGVPEKTTLLDLYSGCGGMSTGLCLGAALAGLRLETKWAVDLNSYACESLKYNHPQTEVRNEKADEFLALIKEWANLCNKYVHADFGYSAVSTAAEDDGSTSELEDDEYVVEKLIGICYGGGSRDSGIYFKVKWQGYGPEHDTWEPVDNLSDCPLKIKEFVQEGYSKRILPLPGDVDVICGGPPCQGISGFNRFRNYNDPLQDEKNKQMVTFMDIVAYLKPKYVLMENVVDILKFADGYLGRYALSCLVAMNYQARLGIVVGWLLWFATIPDACIPFGRSYFHGLFCVLLLHVIGVVLPKYPLPTHDVVVRGGVPNAFSQSIVAYDETQKPSLKKALLLGDAISDLPKVREPSTSEVMEYGASPQERVPALYSTQSQSKFCKLELFVTLYPKTATLGVNFRNYFNFDSLSYMLDYSFGGEAGPDEGKLLDHQPLRLNKDDHQRVQQIPIKKGANFRDLKGVMVGVNNTVEWDPEIERVYLASGKPLNYLFSSVVRFLTMPCPSLRAFIEVCYPFCFPFLQQPCVSYISYVPCYCRPFGRLWWDETVPTVVTRAEPHNQIILHPDQARVLTVRENARLQGFPDYYRLFGPIKEKYIQVGNAVAVPVARALGHCLGQAYLGESDGSDPLCVLPDSSLPWTNCGKGLLGQHSCRRGGLSNKGVKMCRAASNYDGWIQLASIQEHVYNCQDITYCLVICWLLDWFDECTNNGAL
ncbi:hypothetical protein EJB05_48168, partial [Eragrostis curvula]